MKLKKIEKEILYLLSNGMIRNSDLAKKLKTSKQVIYYHIRGLSEKGIIKKIIPIINYPLLSGTWFRVLMRFTNTTPKKEEEIVQFVLKNRHVKRVYKTDNYFDLIIKLADCTMAEAYAIYLQIEERYGKYIIEDYVDVIISKKLFPCRMLSGRHSRHAAIKIDTASDPVELKEKERALIHELEKNALTDSVALSSKLHISPKTAIAHRRRLEREQVILGYTLLIDWKKLGKVHYKIMIDPFIYETGKFSELKEHLESNEKIIAISEVISRYMLEFDIIVDNYNEILELMSSIKERFADLIRGYDIIHVREEY